MAQRVVDFAKVVDINQRSQHGVFVARSEQLVEFSDEVDPVGQTQQLIVKSIGIELLEQLDVVQAHDNIGAENLKQAQVDF